jgi:uncharacterized protein (DUF1330 family)
LALPVLHAQTKPSVYSIAEGDVTDLDGYVKEVRPERPRRPRTLMGVIPLAAGQKVTAIEGMPPKNRVVVMRWNSIEQLRAWRDSAQYKQDRKIGDKYAAQCGRLQLRDCPKSKFATLVQCVARSRLGLVWGAIRGIRDARRQSSKVSRKFRTVLERISTRSR